MKLIVILILFFTLPGCSQQTKLDKLILQLRSSDFGDVYEAKDSIVNYGRDGIPRLIKLLRDTSFVKLKNTADLIYPGAGVLWSRLDCTL